MNIVPQFTVTKKAMRPASTERCCFHCRQPIGEKHGPECPQVIKKIRVRMIVEYERTVPAHWDEDQILFAMNDGTWCADNALDEIEEYKKSFTGCLCQDAKFEVISADGVGFLKE